MPKKNIALVLASGGSRGLAHIGAIDVLTENGFNITSIAGSSMGALVGGLYAAGGLEVFKEWMQDVDRLKVFSLIDFSFSSKGFVKGDKIMEELKTLVPDVRIEALPIPYAAVSTDIRHRREVVFESGSLYEAIRASISIPSFFTPHRIGDMILIDGGITNPIPLDRVTRTANDLLVAVDLNAPFVDDDDEVGLVSVLDDSFDLMQQINSQRTIDRYRPDVLVRIAKNAYNTMEFFRYEEIVSTGRVKTTEALKAAGLI